MDDRFDGRLVALDRLVLEQWAQAKLDEAHALLALLDRADRDPELEDNNDREADHSDDEPDDDAHGDVGWTEFHTRGRHKLNPGVTDKAGLPVAEDAEEDDPAGQYDEDCYTGPMPCGSGAGCEISDPGGCQHDGREPTEDGV